MLQMVSRVATDCETRLLSPDLGMIDCNESCGLAGIPFAILHIPKCLDIALAPITKDVSFVRLSTQYPVPSSQTLCVSVEISRSKHCE